MPVRLASDKATKPITAIRCSGFFFPVEPLPGLKYQADVRPTPWPTSPRLQLHTIIRPVRAVRLIEPHAKLNTLVVLDTQSDTRFTRQPEEKSAWNTGYSSWWNISPPSVWFNQTELSAYRLYQNFSMAQFDHMSDDVLQKGCDNKMSQCGVIMYGHYECYAYFWIC